MSALRVERDGELLRVTLARPERRNAFDADLIRELGDAFADVGDARAVVLAGEGPSFCAGADVEWQRSSIDLSYEGNVEDYRRLYQMLQAIFRCPAPVIVRVHGFALGGGSGLTACADICIAAEDAVFGFSEVRLRIGLVDEVAADPDKAVASVVDSILAGGPTAVREAKRLVLEPGEEEDLLARAAERRTSAEGQEGLRAFLDTRGGERVHPAWHPDRV